MKCDPSYVSRTANRLHKCRRDDCISCFDISDLLFTKYAPYELIVLDITSFSYWNTSLWLMKLLIILAKVIFRTICCLLVTHFTLHLFSGEMLPPQFTYFLDMSEFLKLHPHIGIKLGEEGKHILQVIKTSKQYYIVVW